MTFSDSILEDLALSLAAHICQNEKPSEHNPNARGVVCVVCQIEARRVIAKDAEYITGKR